MKTNAINYLLIIIITASTTFVGCKRPAKPEAIITITTVDAKPVSGATVFLHAYDVPNKPGEKEFTEKTDASGNAYFKFDHEAIYTVEATKDSLYGTGTVKLEMGEIAKKTILAY